MVTTTVLILTAVITGHFYLALRLLHAPLHPDTGQFLYRGYFKGHGSVFPLHTHPIGSLKLLLKDLFTPSGVDFRYSSEFYSRSPKERFLPLSQKLGSYFIAEMIGRRLENPKMFRVYLSVYNAASIIAIYVLGRILFSETTGCVAAALFTFYINIPYADSHQFHAEHLIVLPLIIALILVKSGSLYSMPVLFIVAGAFGALLYILKSSSIIESVFVIISPFFFSRLPWPSLYVLCGFATASMLFFALLATRRLLAPYLYLALSLSSFFDYKKGISFSIHKAEFNLVQNKIRDRFVMYFPFLCQMSLIGFGGCLFFVLFLHAPSSATLFVSIWFFWEAVIVILQGKYYFAHLVSLIPVSVLMAAAAFVDSAHHQNLALLIPAVVALVVACSALVRYWLSSDPLSYQLRLYSSLFHPCTISFAAAEIIAKYVKDNSGPDERLRLWGYNSEFYITSGRRMHTGFDEDKVIGDPPQLESLWGEGWRFWCLRDMAIDPPLYIVDMYGTLNIHIVEKATGFSYRLEKLFFSLFPVYRRGAHGAEQGIITKQDIDLLDTGNRNLSDNGNPLFLSNLIQETTLKVIHQHIAEADALTGRGFSEMLASWRSLNGVKPHRGI